jgi:flagellar protein FliO/FliZ
MQWLNELPFADNRVLQIGFLAACGIAALVVLAIVYRLAFAHRLRVPGGRTRQPRLGLVDAFSLDGQRQLVLIRRDNIEHLVMIGGPNDVLVESQINRAAVPARESAQASPLLVPSTPVRQAPLPAPTSAAAEAPAKVTAKAQAPAPALAGATTAAPVIPAAVAPLAPIPAPAPPTPPPVPKAPAPAQPLAPSQAFVPAQASAPEPARPAVSAAPAATQAAEPARPAPASSPPRQAEPRPAQPRATMPPPILPANASPNRSAPVRVTETAPASAPGNPPSSSSAAPGPSRRPERAEAAAVGSKAEPNVTTVRREPVAASTGTTVPPAGAAQARLMPRTPSSAPAFDGAQKTVDARPPGDKTSDASIDKPSPKVEDPFADLDSLEAEMARLLGREKSD